MECTTLALLKNNRHRYRTNGYIFNKQTGNLDDVILFFDTGCYNTLIPKRLAEITGQSLKFKHDYKIGGQIIQAEAYLIDKIMLGDFAIERIVAFASDYTGEFSSNILIGTNVLNNWKITIDRKENIFQFYENPPEDLPNKKNIYQNYFDSQGNYMLVQDKE